MADNPSELRATIAHYRQMLRHVDDPILRDAIGHLIRLKQAKLDGHETPPAEIHPPVEPARLSAAAKLEVGAMGTGATARNGSRRS